MAYRRAGRTDDAIRVLEEVLKLREVTLGRDDARHARNSEQPGGCVPGSRPTRRGRRAARGGRRRRCRAKLGVFHRDTLTSMSNLAAAYLATGRTAEAIALFELTLKRRRITLGEDHPDTLTSLHNLATVYQLSGRTEEAVKMFEEVLAIRRVKLGRDHHDTLTSEENLAVVSASRQDRRGDFELRGGACAPQVEAQPRAPRHAHDPKSAGRGVSRKGTLVES